MLKVFQGLSFLRLLATEKNQSKSFKRHLHDVLRRQKEEIEKLKNQDRNTEKVNMALYKETG